MDGRPRRLFCDPLRDDFLAVDCSILRKIFLSVAIPPPGFVDDIIPPPDHAEQILELDEQHTCNEVLSNGNICGEVFSSFRALQTHRRNAKDHAFVSPEYHLALTNQCPWCHVTYKSLAHTRRHIKKALASKQCRGTGSIVSIPIFPVEPLVCPKCECEFPSLLELQRHVVGHFGGPTFTDPWN